MMPLNIVIKFNNINNITRMFYLLKFKKSSLESVIISYNIYISYNFLVFV